MAPTLPTLPTLHFSDFEIFGGSLKVLIKSDSKSETLWLKLNRPKQRIHYQKCNENGYFVTLFLKPIRDLYKMNSMKTVKWLPKMQ